jgi:hypothetical protein
LDSQEALRYEVGQSLSALQIASIACTALLLWAPHDSLNHRSKQIASTRMSAAGKRAVAAINKLAKTKRGAARARTSFWR